MSFTCININSKHLKVLLMKLADFLWYNFNKNKNETEHEIINNNQAISEKELYGLQYLGGYVFHKLYKKLKGSKNWRNEDFQQAISILEAGRSTAKKVTTNLTSILDRGGLWQISDEAQKLLTLTEKYFRMKTSTLLQRKIHTKQIVTELMNYSHTKEFFNEIVSVADIDCTTEVCKNTLYIFNIKFIYSSSCVFIHKRHCTKTKVG